MTPHSSTLSWQSDPISQRILEHLDAASQSHDNGVSFQTQTTGQRPAQALACLQQESQMWSMSSRYLTHWLITNFILWLLWFLTFTLELLNFLPPTSHNFDSFPETQQAADRTSNVVTSQRLSAALVVGSSLLPRCECTNHRVACPQAAVFARWTMLPMWDTEEPVWAHHCHFEAHWKFYWYPPVPHTWTLITYVMPKIHQTVHHKLGSSWTICHFWPETFCYSKMGDQPPAETSHEDPALFQLDG